MTRSIFRWDQMQASTRTNATANHLDPHTRPYWAGFFILRQRLQSANLITFATFAWPESDINPKVGSCCGAA
jgi:hypothetical protein